MLVLLFQVAAAGIAGDLEALDTQGKFALTEAGGNNDVAWFYLSGDKNTLIAASLDTRDGITWIMVANRLPAPGALTTAAFAGTYNTVFGFDRFFVEENADDEFPADSGTLTLVPTTETGGTMVFVNDQRGFTVNGTWSYDAASNVMTIFVDAGGEAISLSFYPSADGDDLLPFLDSSVEGGETRTDAMLGFANRVDPSGTLNPAEAPAPLPQMTADEFVTFFRDTYGQGLSEDNTVATMLSVGVGGAAYSQADWSAENYWFQTSNGDVYSLWHGGAVHLKPDGQYTWVLTNLAEAAGLIGEIDFAPGSLSGVIASWRAFSIQGVADGQLVSLWWSPESLERQFGNNQNGWVLTPFDQNVFRDPATGEAVGEVPKFLSYTETQSNGRFTFDPRPAGAEQDGGMSVVLVDTSGSVYVVTFTTTVQAVGVPQPERANVWLLENFSDVPAIERFGLANDSAGLEEAFRSRAGF